MLKIGGNYNKNIKVMEDKSANNLNLYQPINKEPICKNVEEK
jgi:hypothetical protein